MKRFLVAGLVFAFALAGCSSGAISGTASGAGEPGRTGPTAVITTAAARQVLSRYAAGVDQAEQQDQTTVLARYVAGSSYSIRATAFKDPTIRQAKPETFTQPTFYIPFRTSYPAWFAVSAHQGDQNVYLVFARESASAQWLEVFEPTVLTGVTVPDIATDRNGNAVPVPVGQAGQLPVAPDALPAAHAKYLDPAPTVTGRACPPGTSKVLAAKLGCVLSTPAPAAGTINFGSGRTDVTDLHDRSVFLANGKGEISVSNRHATTTDTVYALRTSDGGALVFYDLSAVMLLSPGPGFAGLFSIDYPDLITKGKNEDASFEVNYREQFAVDEPQGTPAKPQVVAQFSGAVSASCGGGPCH
ncbi:MAG TPA: hypothetical protein VHV49_09750 [Pseudonocardiaceae bacterium]|nr:hypothetical protein [Pseudonocardiaceae bacterium]